MNCIKCGGPTIELFLSRACKAECDLRPVPMADVPPEGTLSWARMMWARGWDVRSSAAGHMPSVPRIGEAWTTAGWISPRHHLLPPRWETEGDLWWAQQRVREGKGVEVMWRYCSLWLSSAPERWPAMSHWRLERKS